MRCPSMPSTMLLAAWIGGVALVNSLASHARACTPTRTGWWATLAEGEMPANGLLAISYSCSSSCPELPEVPPLPVRVAGTEQKIEGTVSRISQSGLTHAVFAWRPSAEIKEGGYSVELPSSGGSTQRVPFQVVGPVNGELPDALVHPLAQTIDSDEGEHVCCATGPLGSCSPYCYSKQTRRSVLIALDWTSSAPAAKLGQYAHRVLWDPMPARTGGATDPAGSDWQTGRSASAVFHEAWQTYCYSLELKSLSDGTVTQFASGCVAHPVGAVVGVQERDPQRLREHLAKCETPPEGLTEDWCEARAEQCSTPAESCPSLAAACSGPPPSGENASDEGASCAAAPHGSAPSGWLVAALALISAARRRRRLLGLR